MKKILVLLVGLVMAACEGEEWGTAKYSRLHARFSCQLVSSITPLYAAVNNPGIWCTVRTDNTGRRYQYDSPGMTTVYWNITASAQDKAYAWVAGLVIGMPSYPEPGATTTIPTCYDLVCPTCYRVPMDRQLTIDAFGHAACTTCRSRYDLNNQGFIIDGPDDAAPRLYRYRITYLPATNVLLVSN